ncbi:MAG: hypothetical protein HZA54_03580 [Planctomycetes bacterium]|nr:hypothetical protein [Planctomycetota bacterium]
MTQVLRTVGDWLRLARVQNLPTALADVWTGYALAAGLAVAGTVGADPAGGGGTAAPAALLFPAPTRTLGFLSLAALAAYAGGCCLNDLADLPRDRRLHPTRPLPAGRITPVAALLSVLALFATAQLAALAAGGYDSGAVAFMLLLGILLYDALCKRWRLPGSLTMGGLRALNLALGMSPYAQAAWHAGGLLELPLWLGAHVALVTWISTYEESSPHAPGFRAALLLDLALVVGAALRGPDRLPAAAAALPLFLLLGAAGLRAGLEPRRNLTFLVVKAGVVGIPLLDATFLLAHGHAAWAALVAALLLPRFALARILPGT